MTKLLIKCGQEAEYFGLFSTPDDSSGISLFAYASTEYMQEQNYFLQMFHVLHKSDQSELSWFITV